MPNPFQLITAGLLETPRADENAKSLGRKGESPINCRDSSNKTLAFLAPSRFQNSAAYFSPAARNFAKKARSLDAHSSARRPDSTSKRWFSRVSRPIEKSERTAPAFLSSAP